MTEHLPECPKSGCAACYEQGKRDCALTHAIRGLKDINRIAARGYDEGQRDAIAAAVQQIANQPVSLVDGRAMPDDPPLYNRYISLEGTLYLLSALRERP